MRTFEQVDNAIAQAYSLCILMQTGEDPKEPVNYDQLFLGCFLVGILKEQGETDSDVVNCKVQKVLYDFGLAPNETPRYITDAAA